MIFTMWFFAIIGSVEIIANLFFLSKLYSNKDLKFAKKFHGDFPPFATEKAWRNKIILSIILGIVALIASFTIYKGYSVKIYLSGLFAIGMFLLCLVQAILYGKKYKPSIISIAIGLILIALVFLRV